MNLAALIAGFLAAQGIAVSEEILTAPDAGGQRRYELPDLDALEMTLPPGWRDAVDGLSEGAQVTIEFLPESGTGFEVYVSPEWNGTAPGRIQDAETLRESVREAALRQAASPATESPEIRRLQGTDGVGFFFVAADAAPPPEEFGHLVQGALQVGGLVLRFEILTHDPGDPAIAQALAMLQGAVHRDRGPDRP